MNVLDHIQKEHEDYKAKIAEIEASKDNRKKKIFRELYAAIHGHHKAEEEIIFPMVKEKKEVRDVVLEMIEEHSLVSYQFSVVEKTSAKNETWDAKFHVLKEVLVHHLKEEEEEFLPLARKIVPEETLAAILDTFEIFLKEKMKEKKKKLSKK